MNRRSFFRKAAVISAAAVAAPVVASEIMEGVEETTHQLTVDEIFGAQEGIILDMNNITVHQFRPLTVSQLDECWDEMNKFRDVRRRTRDYYKGIEW